ncbi:MAG: lysophospholipid acyltransferase family protein [Bryobacterales bacterium]
MLRAYLLVYPFLAIYVALGATLFVPLTWLIRDIRPIYWVARTGVRLALGLSGVRVRQIHAEYAAAHPTAVFVCNHVSNIDPPALFMALPRIAVILKRELRRIPLLGYVMELGGFIYVNRQARGSRREALEKAVDTLRSGTSLLIFPEGTRSPDGYLLPFRPGPFTMAIEAQTPIVPITVHGTRELMPKGKGTIQPGTITLRFHTPISTVGLTTADRNELIERVRLVMEGSVGKRES